MKNPPPALAFIPLVEPNALASYVRSVTGMNSRFDRFMRGDTAALTRSEIEGFNKIDLHNNAFKTPTVRNAALT